MIITQLNLRELNKYRDTQIHDLKSWELRINEVEKEASEAHVAVINEVDLEGPPTLMEYINAYKVAIIYIVGLYRMSGYKNFYIFWKNTI